MSELREEDGRRRKADTELKTKTPHVNVGKKLKLTSYLYTTANFKQIVMQRSVYIEMCRAE